MAFQEFSKNCLNILMVQLFQHLVFPSAGLFPVIFILDLNDSGCVMLSLGPSLENCHKLPDIFE